jgi:sugar/nucleoside kinase (ribokinase family)
MAEKIRIKDIAERAGVSVGTVDRVLHDRPNVSKPAREKVEQALKEMNYQPNMYASALAYNKSYTFYLLIPKHESEAYWEEIEEGARKCEETRRDFHIDVEILFYERSSEESFREQGQAVIDAQPEGVIVVPSSLEVTREFGFKYVVSTLRESLSATHNGWKALIYDGKEFYQSKHYDINPIIDRVGGGDSFSGGLIHGLLTKPNQAEALEFAVAASALKHTIPGDFNLVSADEVESLAGGNANGRVQR